MPKEALDKSGKIRNTSASETGYYFNENEVCDW